MASIFTQIIQGKIPCHKIAEDDRYFAFLDISPVQEGHTLVVPKEEVDYIFDLTDDTLAGLHVFSKRVAAAIAKAFPCERVGVTVIGLEVPHSHVHLIPINSLKDMNFEKPKQQPTHERLGEVAEAIRAHFE